jgi:hypothetical protein
MGSLSFICQQTPAIKLSIFSPAATCDSLGYGVYQLMCDSRAHTSTASLRKSGAPDITLHGKCIQRIPFMSIPPSGLNSTRPAVPCLLAPAPSDRQPVDRTPRSGFGHFHSPSSPSRLAIEKSHPMPTPEDCRIGIIHLFHESLYNDYTHGGIQEAPVLHISDAVSHNLCHLKTCHPNLERLVLLSKIAKGVPKFKHPQYI